jgi:hypothetical protein
MTTISALSLLLSAQWLLIAMLSAWLYLGDQPIELRPIWLLPNKALQLTALRAAAETQIRWAD